MNVVVLPSARSLDARSNLESFIAKGRASAAFGQVDWDSPVWRDVTLVVEKRVSTGRKAQALHFSLNGGERGAGDPIPMPEPFGQFVKAMVRIREGYRPQAIENHRVMIRAARHLVAELATDGHDPGLLLPDHFDAAARRARAVESPQTAYATGKALAEIANTLNEYNLGRVRIDWKNTIPRPHSQDRVTDEAVARRAAKLPTEAALDALPQLAAMVSRDIDVLRMRVVELLACGGWRINELLTLPADCEVEEPVSNQGHPVLDREGVQVVRYGIRYVAEKGFKTTIKWIPTAMVDVARRAIADARRITQPVRDDAAWMVEHRGRVNIPELMGDQDRVISVTAMAEALGQVNGISFLDGRRIRHALLPGTLRDHGVRVGDVVASILKDVPASRAEMPTHKHLFLIRENATHQQRSEVRGSVRHLTDGMITDFLTGKPGTKSVFETFGLNEPDGTPIKLTSHQFRHWLNTLAQENAMSQELIARWSGRKDMAQNSAYDHVSGRKLAEQVRVMADEGEVRGQLARVSEGLPPADRSAFLQTQLATAHVTDIGLCAHDWSLAPCPVHGDCATCGEHLIDKGNPQQRAETERQLEDVDRLLAVSTAEAAEGTYGASRWQEAHQRQRDGLRAVLAVHEDVSIPVGTLVHLGGR